MRGQKRTMVGDVVSDKMTKTVVVAVTTAKRHPLYGKVVRTVRKYKAHDQAETCREGDRVRIVESRPLSREKRWAVEEILERAE